MENDMIAQKPNTRFIYVAAPPESQHHRRLYHPGPRRHRTQPPVGEQTLQQHKFRRVGSPARDPSLQSRKDRQSDDNRGTHERLHRPDRLHRPLRE